MQSKLPDRSNSIQQPESLLEKSRDREAVFQFFLKTEVQEGSNQNQLSFLDRGIKSSPYSKEIDRYPQRLLSKPDGQTVVSLGSEIQLTNSKQMISFTSYPQVGRMPAIDQTGLEFLHSDIEEACVCVGSLVNGEMQAHWLGRNSLTPAQFWSSTKIVPIVNLVCRVNAQQPQIPIQDCTFCNPSQKAQDITFANAAIDIVSYRNDDDSKGVMTSNATAGMMKRFSSLPELEQWLQRTTGNSSLKFRGYYGADPLIKNPGLRSKTGLILTAVPEGERGDNLVTAYDLTRLTSMVGWHPYLTKTTRLPGAQWHSLQTVVQAMGYDTARYIEAAISRLGLGDTIREPVILSKLGFGASDLRSRIELIFTCLVQFIDDRPLSQSQPSVLRTWAMTLRGASQKINSTGQRDLDEEARCLDARMAAEVTEIMRRLITQELS